MITKRTDFYARWREDFALNLAFAAHYFRDALDNTWHFLLVSNALDWLPGHLHLALMFIHQRRTRRRQQEYQRLVGRRAAQNERFQQLLEAEGIDTATLRSIANQFSDRERRPLTGSLDD